MSASGRVDAVDRDERPDDGRPTWRVMVLPDQPVRLASEGEAITTIAFRVARGPGPAPIAAGDRVVVPLLHGRAVALRRADGSSAIVPMLDGAFDPAAPLT